MKFRNKNTGKVYNGWNTTPCDFLRCNDCLVYDICDALGDDDTITKDLLDQVSALTDYEAIDEESVTYQQNIIALMERQHAKGMKKYGETLEDNTTLSMTQRIEHLQEELIDGLQYCEHIKKVATDNLTANDYQRMAMRTAREDKSQYLDNAVVGLCGEVVECADIVKKYRFQGHELDREHLVDELSDVCWYVALMATALDVSLEVVMQHNIDKLKERYPDGFDKARSINREE